MMESLNEGREQRPRIWLGATPNSNIFGWEAFHLPDEIHFIFSILCHTPGDEKQLKASYTTLR